MNKLKALFNKLKPETPVAIALTKTILSVIGFIVTIVIAITNTPLFGLLVILGIFCFIIHQVYNQFLKDEQNKSRRR